MQKIKTTKKRSRSTNEEKFGKLLTRVLTERNKIENRHNQAVEKRRDYILKKSDNSEIKKKFKNLLSKIDIGTIIEVLPAISEVSGGLNSIYSLYSYSSYGEFELVNNLSSNWYNRMNGEMETATLSSSLKLLLKSIFDGLQEEIPEDLLRHMIMMNPEMVSVINEKYIPEDLRLFVIEYNPLLIAHFKHTTYELQKFVFEYYNKDVHKYYLFDKKSFSKRLFNSIVSIIKDDFEKYEKNLKIVDTSRSNYTMSFREKSLCEQIINDKLFPNSKEYKLIENIHTAAIDYESSMDLYQEMKSFL